MSHFISLEKAKSMTALYRQQKENILDSGSKGKNILAICESFDRSPFDQVLGQDGCVGLRIYFGMDESWKVHAIVVGVNSEDEDILPAELTSLTGGDSDDESLIIEEGNRCPDMCPPPSPLNG